MTPKERYQVKPKLIAFDIGGTVFDDGACQPIWGLEAIRRHCNNGDTVTAEEMTAVWNDVTQEITPWKTASGFSTDIPLSAVLRHVLFRTGLQPDTDMTTLEDIFDRYNSTRCMTPGLKELIDYLNRRDIAVGILSNNMMSGDALRRTLRRELPAADPVFCVSSADFLLCKPCPTLFTACRVHCGLKPEEMWYAGNDYVCDVKGSLSDGWCGVFYNRIQSAPEDGTLKEIPSLGWYLDAPSWESVIHRLEKCK